MERRQTIHNRSDRLMIVFTEPEAQYYWLNPGEKLEIRAPITYPDAQFEISLHEEGIAVWPSHEMGYISTWQNNTLFECGHQRPKIWPQDKAENPNGGPI